MEHFVLLCRRNTKQMAPEEDCVRLLVVTNHPIEVAIMSTGQAILIDGSRNHSTEGCLSKQVSDSGMADFSFSPSSLNKESCVWWCDRRFWPQEPFFLPILW